jgi:D-3-phosphoglycerate dehydrogenase / 2-oxoglutarate reductase
MIRRGRAMKVLITDHKFPHVEIERSLLASEGATLEVADGPWLAAAKDADALLVQYAKLDAAAMGTLERCRLIVRYGIGVDALDMEAASAQGIAVSNVPDYGLDEVADHAMALLLAGFRRLPGLQASIRQGRWGVPAERPLISLSDATLGGRRFRCHRTPRNQTRTCLRDAGARL